VRVEVLPKGNMAPQLRGSTCTLLLMFACCIVCRTDARPLGFSSVLQLTGASSTFKNELPNGRPLIGILSQPGDGDGNEVVHKDKQQEFNTSYIAASYVKFVESGGARAVPIMYDASDEELERVSRCFEIELIELGIAEQFFLQCNRLLWYSSVPLGSSYERLFL
jgi:hypothetical protein